MTGPAISCHKVSKQFIVKNGAKKRVGAMALLRSVVSRLGLMVGGLLAADADSSGSATSQGGADGSQPQKGPKVVKTVDDVSFQVQAGEIFGILGPNGSGKSTLIRMMATLLLPDAGTIKVLDRDTVTETKEVRRLINRVSVEASFFMKLSAMENLRYAARLYGLEPKSASRRAVEILARLGLEEDKIYGPLEDLSRGMQQKVSIARALLTEPAVLLLDEPTTGLDPKSKKDVQDFVLEVREQRGTTIILTSHDMAEAERLCHRVAIIDSGQFVALDTPEGLKGMVTEEPVGREMTLEDVFFSLTGKKLKDNENTKAAAS